MGEDVENRRKFIEENALDVRNLTCDRSLQAWVKLIEGDLVRSSIVVLKRSRRIAKQEWREPSCDRTLVPIDVDPLIRSIWQANQSELPEQSFVELVSSSGWLAGTAPSIHSIQGHQKAFIGVFSVSFVSRDRAEVILLDEKCSIQLGTHVGAHAR